MEIKVVKGKPKKFLNEKRKKVFGIHLKSN